MWYLRFCPHLHLRQTHVRRCLMHTLTCTLLRRVNQSGEGNLWHFIVVSRFLSLYFKTANLWTWSAAAACLYVWIFSLLLCLHVSEVWEMERMAGAREDARWLLWNNTVAPILRKLESVAAGAESGDVENRRSAAVASVVAFRLKMKHRVSTFPPRAAKTHVRVIIWFERHSECEAATSLLEMLKLWCLHTGEMFIFPLKQWKDTTLLFLYVKIVSLLLVFLPSITNLEKGRGMFLFFKAADSRVVDGTRKTWKLHKHAATSKITRHVCLYKHVCLYEIDNTHTESCVFISVEVWKVPVRPDLNGSLSALSSGSAEASADRLCDLCQRLHGALKEAAMLGRSCARRSGILRTLFRLVDLDSARLSLQIAELCLAVSFHWVCGWGCVWVSAEMGLFSCILPAAGRQWKQPAQHLQTNLPD